VQPFTASSYHLFVGKMLTESPRAPHELDPDIPRPLSELILRTLARDRAERPSSATELYDALGALSDDLDD
jgi:hypothetical protein